MKLFRLKHDMLKTRIWFAGFSFTINHVSQQNIAKNYARKLTEIKSKIGKEKIKVGFLVSEPAKWQYQSMYNEFDNDKQFAPVVLVTQLEMTHQGKKNYHKTMEDCYNFFVSKGLNVRCAYDKEHHAYLKSENFDVDILFYQQPYDLDIEQHPIMVSENALTCYIPYGIHLMENSKFYINDFHPYLWKMFIEDKDQLTHIPSENCIYSPYAKFDEYFTLLPHKSNKKVIIYAPHHSFEKKGLQCATFKQNGRDILQLALKYQHEFSWVFKPHPRFKTAVIQNKIMKEEEIEAYYESWRTLGSICEDSHYFQLFVDSDALITDCVSFLGEYLPSTNPIFHLKSSKAKFNSFAHSFIDTFYSVNTVDQLEHMLIEVIKKGNDFKKDERLSKINLLFDSKMKSASKILEILKEELKDKK